MTHVFLLLDNRIEIIIDTLMFIYIDYTAAVVYNIRHYGGKHMGRKAVTLMPKTQEILSQMGEQIKLARLRRKLPVELVAQQAGISRATLWSVEKGAPSVSMGTYASVLHALNNMDKDLLLVAKDDELGRKLQDLDLPVRKRAPKRGAD